MGVNADAEAEGLFIRVGLGLAVAFGVPGVFASAFGVLGACSFFGVVLLDPIFALGFAFAPALFFSLVPGLAFAFGTLELPGSSSDNWSTL